MAPDVPSTETLEETTYQSSLTSSTSSYGSPSVVATPSTTWYSSNGSSRSASFGSTSRGAGVLFSSCGSASFTSSPYPSSHGVGSFFSAPECGLGYSFYLSPPSLLPPSTKSAKELYREYAEHYYDRFRAAIDYQYEEKPRQISCGLLLLVILAYFAWGYTDFLIRPNIPESLLTTRASNITPTTPLPVTFGIPFSTTTFSGEVHQKEGPSAAPWCSPLCYLFSNRSLFTFVSSTLRVLVLSVLVALSVYSFLQTRDGLLVRPHPGFWRIVHAFGLFHFLLMTILLMLTPEMGRTAIGILFPDISEHRRATYIQRQEVLGRQSTTRPQLSVDLWSQCGKNKSGMAKDLLSASISLLTDSPHLSVSKNKGEKKGKEGKGQKEVVGVTEDQVVVVEEKEEKESGVFAGTLSLDCSLSMTTFLRQLETPWFAAHVIGWLLKMCIFRDWHFCLVYSATFELCELSFQWIVPELKECWWDSVIVDFLLANVLGMLLGVLCLRLLHSYQYDWVGLRPFYNKALLRFMPFTWSSYHWQFFSTPWRLLQCIPMLVCANVIELNVFFFMYALDIPAVHFVNPLRCLLLCGLGTAAVAEHYEFINSKGKRLGHNEWLIVEIVAVECLVCAKYRLGTTLPPRDVWMCWGFALLFFALWCCAFFVKVKLSPLQLTGRKNERGVLDVSSVHETRGWRVKEYQEKEGRLLEFFLQSPVLFFEEFCKRYVSIFTRVTEIRTCLLQPNNSRRGGGVQQPPQSRVSPQSSTDKTSFSNHTWNLDSNTSEHSKNTINTSSSTRTSSSSSSHCTRDAFGIKPCQTTSSTRSSSSSSNRTRVRNPTTNTMSGVDDSKISFVAVTAYPKMWFSTVCEVIIAVPPLLTFFPLVFLIQNYYY